MILMTRIKKLSVSQVAARLDKPFSMLNVALVGDVIISVYVCQGMVEWHKHLDRDELFWVHEGTILLESEWGEVRLRPGELAVVPKGVGHRSGSGLRASVLLLRRGPMSGRDNGRHRLYAVDDDEKLERISLKDAVQALDQPFQFHTVVKLEDSVVQVARGEGTWSVEIPAPREMLFFVLKGTATVRTSQSMLHMHPGDLTVVPRGVVYQLSTTRDTALVRVTSEGGE